MLPCVLSMLCALIVCGVENVLLATPIKRLLHFAFTLSYAHDNSNGEQNGRLVQCKHHRALLHAYIDRGKSGRPEKRFLCHYNEILTAQTFYPTFGAVGESMDVCVCASTQYMNEWVCGFSHRSGTMGLHVVEHNGGVVQRFSQPGSDMGTDRINIIGVNVGPMFTVSNRSITDSSLWVWLCVPSSPTNQCSSSLHAINGEFVEWNRLFWYIYLAMNRIASWNRWNRYPNNRIANAEFFGEWLWFNSHHLDYVKWINLFSDNYVDRLKQQIPWQRN